jgi:ERCC4-type nuclease
MTKLQEYQVVVKLTSHQLLLINYAIKELAIENKKYDDFASSLIVDQSEELLSHLKSEFHFIK